MPYTGKPGPISMGRTFKWKANPDSSSPVEFDFDVAGTLADGALWQGDKGDLRVPKKDPVSGDLLDQWAPKHWFRSYIDPSSAPAEFTVVSWYLGTSDSSTAATRNDGALSGSNGTYAAGQDPLLSSMIELGSHIFDGVDTSAWHNLGIFELPSPFVMPLIDNNIGQTIADEGIELWVTELFI